MQNNECVWGTSFIGGQVGISWNLILIVDFKSFEFIKVYKSFGV